ncbi:MAG: 5-formyltetrahydrofolate cyclo-ligase [Actinomycetota bacterium]|jgi:5-formyltetrahydrofolate cyclo-ligase|nr:5-formyltetrahydrofolate cyclo-ligase [Actinomycetota bacterium]
MTRHSDPGRSKARIRLQARSARQSVPDFDRATLSAEACWRLLELPRVSGVRTALVYGATPEEIDPTAAIRELRARGVRIAYPRIDGPGTLTLHEVQHESELEVGFLGVREPAPDAPLVPPHEIDLVIAPGVAFDAHGRRLGYGGGFYDRLLSGMPHTYTIGVCFDGQIVDEVPTEPHDAIMDAVVTPTTAHA